MAIYYVDPFKNTDGTGTFADPKGMWFSTPFTLGVGDELRIIGRTLASMLTATEYTVTIRDSASFSTGGGLTGLTGGSYLDFQQHDMVYFPDYDVFMRLSATTFTASGSYNSGSYNAIPIPVAGKLTGVRMRLVDRTILPTFTSILAYITSAASNNGYSVTDNWTADGVRTTDGTAKTLITTAATGSSIALRFVATTSVITELLKNVPQSNIDMSNSFVIAGKSTSQSTQGQFIDVYNAVVNISQLYSNGTNNSTLSGSSGATMYGYGNNITIKNINFYSTLISQLATNSSYKFENVVSHVSWQSTDAYSRYCSATTIEIGSLFASTSNNANFNYFSGSQDLTFRVLNGIHKYDTVSATNVISFGNGNAKVEFGTGFVSTYNNSTATPVNVTTSTYAVLDNTQFAQQNETYYRKPNVPAGFTVTNEFGLAIPAGSSVYPLGNGKRVATRKMVLEGFSAANILLGGITQQPFSVNTIVISADGGIAPVEVLSVQGSSVVGTTGYASLFVASQDNTIFKTNSPSLKFNLVSYNLVNWISNHPTRKARAYKNTAIPCVNGIPITVSGWVRTSDTSYVSGDFSVSLVDANGDDVAAEFNPTSAFINAWEQFSFTVTPTYTGELFLAFGMTGYRGGQTYWVSDMGVA